MPLIRNSAKAIIIQSGQLLTIKNRDPVGDFYILPGGGQEHHETLHEALRWECKEEIDVEIVIGRLQFVLEYIGAHHEFSEYDGEVHQIEFMFRCALEEGLSPFNVTILDTYQIGIYWLPIAQLDRYRLYPAVLKELQKQSVVAKSIPTQKYIWVM